jgi:hypothetical protein
MTILAPPGLVRLTLTRLALAVAAAAPLACLHAADRAGPAPVKAPAAPLPTAAAAAVVHPAPAPDARTAVQRALGFLERDGVDWMNGRTQVQGGEGCVSCHHVGFGLWSHREALRAGLPVAAERIDALEKQAHGFFAENPGKGEPVPWSQLLLGRAASGKNALAAIAWPSVLDKIVQDQEKAGLWEASGQFPSQKRPSLETDAVATMWILLAFGGFERLPPPVAASRDRAYAWLKTSAPGTSNEWLLARMLVEQQLGEAKAAQAFQAQLLAQQQADGGWGWQKADPSNAYSTGQTLYALSLAGLPATDPALSRGIAHLRSTQQPDGTWIVSSALTSKRPSARRDYIYKYWGTAWATIGLARTLQGAAPSPGVAARDRAP